MLVSLGPIAARFTGEADLSYADADRSGRVSGRGQDQASGTRLTAEAMFTLRDDGPAASILYLDVSYALRGALAQFSRGPIVRALAAEMAEQVGRGLEARLLGETAPVQVRLSGTGLAVRVVWRWLRALLSRRHGA